MSELIFADVVAFGHKIAYKYQFPPLFSVMPKSIYLILIQCIILIEVTDYIIQVWSQLNDVCVTWTKSKKQDSILSAGSLRNISF